MLGGSVTPAEGILGSLVSICAPPGRLCLAHGPVWLMEKPQWILLPGLSKASPSAASSTVHSPKATRVLTQGAFPHIPLPGSFSVLWALEATWGCWVTGLDDDVLL